MLVYRHARRAAACRDDAVATSVVAASQDDDAIDHPVQLLQGVVAEIERPAGNVRIVRIRPDRPMRFSPGQYAKLRFVGGLERCYSIASVDGDDLLEFHIRLMPAESAGSHLAGRLRVGDGLGISGPHGASYLRRSHEGPMICVAGGTGLAPVLSIVRGALEFGSGHPVHLYYGEKADADVYAAARLAELEKRFSNLRVHIVIDAGSGDERRRKGPVTEALSSDWARADDMGYFRAYIGGSPAMACAVRDILVERGMPLDHIHSDAFPARRDAFA